MKNVTEIQVLGNDTVAFYNGTDIVMNVSQVIPNTSVYMTYGNNSITLILPSTTPFTFSVLPITQIGAVTYTPLTGVETQDVITARVLEIYTQLASTVFKGCCDCGSGTGGCTIEYQYNSDLSTGQWFYDSGTGKLQFSETSYLGQNFAGFFPVLPNNSWVFLVSDADPTIYAIFQVLNYANMGTYIEYDATLIDGSTTFVVNTVFCVSLAAAGGSAIVSITAGNLGLSVSGSYPSFTISNDMTITGGTGITIGGTYPNYVINSTGGGTGTVTSIDVDGGTGISVSPAGPITTSGTFTVTNTAPDQVVSLTSGTGISTSGTYPNFTITNTAPDQVVSLSAGTGISTSGTYPSFTVTNTAPDQVVSLTAGTGISISGSYPSFTLQNILPDQTVVLTQGGTTTITGTYPSFTISSADQYVGTVTSVGLSAPSAFTVSNSPVTSTGNLTFTGAGTTAQYIDGTGALQTMPTGLPPTGAAGGDLQGTYPNPTVHGIHGIDMQSGTPTANDVWIYGGSPAKWQHQHLNASQADNDSAVTGATIKDALDHLNTTKVESTRSISTTAPLSGGGDLSANRTLSITQATTSTDGYLSSTDWNTFNNKGSGTVTSVSALTLGTSGTDLSSTVANGTTTPVITLNVPTASASNRGALSSTDWSTFNNKVPSTRTLTINGTGYDLSADRSWTVTAGSADLPEISVSTSNAREDDYAPTGWPNSTNVVKVIRINSTNTNYMMSLGGLSNPAAGRIVTIYNSSTANNLIVIENLSTSSTAANRFRMTGNVAYFLLPNRSVTFIYDGTYWTQLSASSTGGFDFFDDATSGGSASITTSFGGLMGSHASGTAAGPREGSPTSVDGFGEIDLVTGSTATGFCTLSALVRRGGSNGSFGGDSTTSSMPYLVVGKVAIGSAATVAQDYRMHFGMNGTSSLPTNAPGVGYLWVYQGTSSPSFWDVRTQNVGGTTSTVTTSLAITANTYVWLGVYKPGGSTIRDAVYFYSTNGVTYSVASKFVGVSGSYGGSPTIVVGSIAGTTAKDGFYDWIGSSFNLAR